MHDSAMSNRLPKHLSVALAALLTSISISGEAEIRPPDLEVGLSQAGVLTRWGAPAEKHERETKREEEWSYRGGMRVVFREGKVSRWTREDSPVSIETPPPTPTSTNDRPTRKAQPAEKLSDAEANEILVEMSERSAAGDGN